MLQISPTTFIQSLHLLTNLKHPSHIYCFYQKEYHKALLPYVKGIQLKPQ